VQSYQGLAGVGEWRGDSVTVAADNNFTVCEFQLQGVIHEYELFFTEHIEASTLNRCKVSPGVEKEMDRLRRIEQHTLAQFAVTDTDVPKPKRPS
jgi:hypothetical protein